MSVGNHLAVTDEKLCAFDPQHQGSPCLLCSLSLLTQGPLESGGRHCLPLLPAIMWLSWLLAREAAQVTSSQCVAWEACSELHLYKGGLAPPLGTEST